MGGVVWTRSDPLRNPTPLIKRVYAYVSYRIGPCADADDVTGEVFARAVRYRSTYDDSKGDPVSWLLGIARRVLADRGAAQGYFGEIPEDLPDDATPAEEAVVEAVALRAAVARLSERDRDLIALRYGADLSAKQIAELVGSKVHAVEVSLSRALSRLRALLEEKPPQGCEESGTDAVPHHRP
jgi:RNA polymerase sigma factor (sigma-70 family)